MAIAPGASGAGVARTLPRARSVAALRDTLVAVPTPGVLQGDQPVCRQHHRVPGARPQRTLVDVGAALPSAPAPLRDAPAPSNQAGAPAAVPAVPLAQTERSQVKSPQLYLPTRESAARRPRLSELCRDRLGRCGCCPHAHIMDGGERMRSAHLCQGEHHIRCPPQLSEPRAMVSVAGGDHSKCVLEKPEEMQRHRQASTCSCARRASWHSNQCRSIEPASAPTGNDVFTTSSSTKLPPVPCSAQARIRISCVQWRHSVAKRLAGLASRAGGAGVLDLAELEPPFADSTCLSRIVDRPGDNSDIPQSAQGAQGVGGTRAGPGRCSHRWRSTRPVVRRRGKTTPSRPPG